MKEKVEEEEGKMVIGREGSEEGQFRLYIPFFPFLRHGGFLFSTHTYFGPGCRLHAISIVSYHIPSSPSSHFGETVWEREWRFRPVYIFFFPLYMSTSPQFLSPSVFSSFCFFSVFAQSDGSKMR